MATNLIIDATDPGGNKIQQIITDVDPNATNAKLKTLAQNLNTAAGNTYVSGTRVERTSIDASGGGAKSQLSVRWIGSNTVTLADLNTAIANRGGYTFHGTFYIDDQPAESTAFVYGKMLETTPDSDALDAAEKFILFYACVDAGGGGFTVDCTMVDQDPLALDADLTFTINIPETETTAATSTTFTITV